MKPGRPLLVAGAGFGLALLAAGWISRDAGTSPAAALYTEVTGYLDALGSGDPRRAATYRLDSDWRPERGRAGGLDGRTWFLRALAVGGDGREALAQVQWLDARGMPAHAEEQVWRRDRAGRWRFEGLGRGPGTPSPLTPRRR